MLTDSERKLLAILRNKISKHRVPSLHLLKAKTGRDEVGLRKVLSGLIEKGYVKWDREQSVEAVELLKTWEEQNTKLASTAQQEAWWEALVR
jgi:predicted transcriptional regulator